MLEGRSYIGKIIAQSVGFGAIIAIFGVQTHFVVVIITTTTNQNFSILNIVTGRALLPCSLFQKNLGGEDQRLLIKTLLQI